MTEIHVDFSESIPDTQHTRDIDVTSVESSSGSEAEEVALLVSQVLRNSISGNKGYIFDYQSWWYNLKNRRGISPLVAETRLFHANHESGSHSKHWQLLFGLRVIQEPKHEDILFPPSLIEAGASIGLAD